MSIFSNIWIISSYKNKNKTEEDTPEIISRELIRKHLYIRIQRHTQVNNSIIITLS